MKSLFKVKNIIYFISLILLYSIVQILIAFNIINQYYQINLFTICINIILAVSLNLIVGYTGLLSLGHAGFMAIGAYTSAIITLSIPSPYAFVLGILIGAIISAFVGFLIGIPTLRLRGDYLAIATLGLGEIIRILFLNLEFTGGASGLNGIPRYVNWTWLFILTAGTIIIINNFIKSSYGRACISIREDEIASDSMGVNTTAYKILAFSIGAFFAGIAGALYANCFYFIKPDIFKFQKSIDILVIVVFGGLGSMTGSIVAAIVLALISAYLQTFPELRMVIYSVILIIIMIYRPQGLMGTKEFSIDNLFKRKASKIKER